MANGLNITLNEFKGMLLKEQNVILFQNTEQIKYMIRSYKIRQWMQWSWLGVLTSGILILFKFHIN